MMMTVEKFKSLKTETNADSYLEQRRSRGGADEEQKRSGGTEWLLTPQLLPPQSDSFSPERGSFPSSSERLLSYSSAPSSSERLLPPQRGSFPYSSATPSSSSERLFTPPSSSSAWVLSLLLRATPSSSSERLLTPPQSGSFPYSSAWVLTPHRASFLLAGLIAPPASAN